MANSAANLNFSLFNSPLVYRREQISMEQLVQQFYRHLNKMEESNSNASAYRGTRQGKKEEEEEYVYMRQRLLSATTIVWISTQFILLPHTVPPGLI